MELAKKSVLSLGLTIIFSCVLVFFLDFRGTIPYVVGNIVAVFILILFQVAAVGFTTWQAVVSVFGIVRYYRTRHIKEPEHEPQKKFALIVCAHNEEVVVGDITRNLVDELKYPKDLYDVYVICDNCTDSTAEVVRECGGIAMERFDLEKKGKGYGLEWMFDQLWEMEKDGIFYDAVCVFDADNLISDNFLAAMNNKLNNGHEVIQGYLDSKNPRDSWVTKSYAVSYWATAAIYQNIRPLIGLSAQLGGTGMCISTQILKTIGWGTESLTEDLEFTAKYVMERNKPVAWAHNAILYDEKPVDFKTTWKQRIRWMIGHVNCSINQGWDALKSAIKNRSFLQFDIWMYLHQPARVVMVSSLLFFLFATLFGFLPQSLERFLIDSWLWTFTLILSYSIPIYGLFMEKRRFSELLYMIYGYIFSFSWIPIVILAIKRRHQREWNPTKHVRTTTMKEIQQQSVNM